MPNDKTYWANTCSKALRRVIFQKAWVNSFFGSKAWVYSNLPRNQCILTVVFSVGVNGLFNSTTSHCNGVMVYKESKGLQIKKKRNQKGCKVVMSNTVAQVRYVAWKS